MTTTRRQMFSLAIGGLLLSVSNAGLAQPVRTTIVKPKAAATAKTDRPAWRDVEAKVKSTLGEAKGYQAGDLITREDAQSLLTGLKQLGWEVKEQGTIAERMLPASDDLVKQLRGTEGVRFMRDIGKVAEGFDRLDHLRSLPDGPKRLKELMRQPGGATLIQYLATTPGGQNMGRGLSSKKRGDFNAPTKRIYTESQLLAELKTRYDAESLSLPAAQ